MKHEWRGRIRNKVRGLKLQTQGVVATAWHSIGAHLSRKPLVCGSHADVVVSMASHGPRLPKVAACIQSIGSGKLRPGRIILTIDEGDRVPRSLARMIGRGLELKRGKKEYGPHNKYFAFVSSEPQFRGVLVTADDDILYPRRWLRSLLAHSRPGVVAAFRGHAIEFRGQKIAPYSEWSEPSSSDVEPIFVTGVSGVAYPQDFVRQLAALGDGFVSVCARQDDVWLNRLILRGGFRVSLVEGRSLHFPMVWGTQGCGLVHENVGEGANDRVIEAAYSEDDVRTLLAMSSTVGS